MNTAIEVYGLTKQYGNHIVLKNLNFTVYEGEIFALLGVNGAGKTTTLECIEGLKKADDGQIRINGKMGIQLQSASLPERIQAREAVSLFAYWNQTEPDPGLLETMGIQEFAKKQYVQLSTGQKRRLHLALGNPDILILDEPTAGLDVEGRIALHEQIRQLKAQGKTMVLASHDMVEVESLCDRIGILIEGKLAFVGTVAQLNEKIGKQYNISIRSEAGVAQFATEDIAETLLTLLAQYKAEGKGISDIHVDRGSLEQHFISMTRGEK